MQSVLGGRANLGDFGGTLNTKSLRESFLFSTYFLEFIFDT